MITKFKLYENKNLISYQDIKNRDIKKIINFIKNSDNLDIYMKRGYTFLISLIINNYGYDIIDYTIKNGADVNLTDNHHNSPLMWCVETTNNDIVELLLNNNANPNICDESNYSPLMNCAYLIDNEYRFFNVNVKKIRNLEKILYLLIDYDADWNIECVKGRDFLYYLKNTKYYNKIIKKYPEKFKKYLRMKDVDKFNL